MVLGMGQSFSLRIRLSESSAQAKEVAVPFKDVNLFGEELDRYLLEDKDKKKVF